MVNLLTDYTTQIYHALSTDARPDADPGAQLREIDTGKRYIYDGTSWNELPDGGGGGEAHPYIQTFDYVQATDWTTDANGNIKNFIDTYCNHGNGLYWFGVDQSNSDAYRAVRGFALRPTTGTIATSNSIDVLRGSNSWSTSYGTVTSFHMVAGSAIRIWYVPITTALEDMTS